MWNADSVLAFSAWTVPGVGDKATGRAIVLVHELGDDVWNDTNQVLARAYADAGFTVFAIQLRAHGISDGEWLGLGWHEREDIRAAVDFLLGEGFLPGRIGIHGTRTGLPPLCWRRQPSLRSAPWWPTAPLPTYAT